MDASIWLGVVQLPQLANENSEGPLCGGWHDSIAEESQLIGAIVCGDVQDGIVQPMGRPISVSTQRGLSLDGCIMSIPSGQRCFSLLRLPLPPVRPNPWPPVELPALVVGHIPLTISGKFCPRNSHFLHASGEVAPLWSLALGVAHDNPWRLPSELMLAGAAWPRIT
jgi:hypothetical protein